MAHWKQRETVFGEYELALTMLGRWQLRPSDSPYRWLYRSAEKHKEHLTLTREEFEGGGAGGGELADLRRVVSRHRRGMELGFGRVADLTMSEPEYGERFGVTTATYAGHTASAEHHFQTLFICLSRTVWTLVYDAFRMTAEQAEAQATALFGAVTLRD